MYHYSSLDLTQPQTISHIHFLLQGGENKMIEMKRDYTQHKNYNHDQNPSISYNVFQINLNYNCIEIYLCSDKDFV